MLTLICGVPKSGKTTYSMQYDNVIHLDGIGYHAVKEKVSEIEGDVVVDGIYNHPQLRSGLVQAYIGQGTRCIWIDTSLEVRKSRRVWQPCYDMEFIPPTLAEGWDEIIILNGDKLELRGVKS